MKPLIRIICLFSGIFLFEGNLFSQEQICVPDQFLNDDRMLRMDEALQRAFAYAPALKNVDIELLVKEAEYVQAGLIPNPIFAVEADDLGSHSVQSQSWDSPSVSYTISQDFELGGKRSARKRLVNAEQWITLRDQEAALLDVQTFVIKAFVNVAAAQEKLKITQEQFRVAQEALGAVAEKVKAGKVSLIQEHKAEIETKTAQLSLSHAARHFELMKKKLAVLWGCCEADFDDVDYPFFEIIPFPLFQDLCKLLECNPDLLRSEAEIVAAEEALSLEKTLRVPDLTLSTGVASYRDPDETTFLLAAEMAIPVWNLNQGNIQRAKHLISLAQNKWEERRLDLEMALASEYDEYMHAYETALSLKDDILIKALHSFESTREGFNQGKYEYLELLDAQRTLFDIQSQYIDILAEYHARKAGIERLIGKCCLSDFDSTSCSAR